MGRRAKGTTLRDVFEWGTIAHKGHWICKTEHITFEGKSYSPRRISLHLYKRFRLNSKWEVVVTCNNPECCHPDHLRAVRRGTRAPESMPIRYARSAQEEHIPLKSIDDFEHAAPFGPDICEHPSPTRLHNGLHFCGVCLATLKRNNGGWQVMDLRRTQLQLYSTRPKLYPNS